jgi:hypothetical protein
MTFPHPIYLFGELHSIPRGLGNLAEYLAILVKRGGHALITAYPHIAAPSRGL